MSKELEQAARDYKERDMAKGDGAYYNSGRVPAFVAGANWLLSQGLEVWVVEGRGPQCPEWTLQHEPYGPDREVLEAKIAQIREEYDCEGWEFRFRRARLVLEEIEP